VAASIRGFPDEFFIVHASENGILANLPGFKITFSPDSLISMSEVSAMILTSFDRFWFVGGGLSTSSTPSFLHLNDADSDFCISNSQVSNESFDLN